jgi:hypothetical protein
MTYDIAAMPGAAPYAVTNAAGVMGFPHPSISLCFGPFCMSPLTQIE